MAGWFVRQVRKDFSPFPQSVARNWQKEYGYTWMARPYFASGILSLGMAIAE